MKYMPPRKSEAATTFVLSVLAVLGLFLLATFLGMTAGSTGKGQVPVYPDDSGTGRVSSTAQSTSAAPALSSCERAAEAFLVGSPTDVERALKALKVDRWAPLTARQYADSYLGRDADDPQLRRMDRTLIETSCASARF